MSNIEIARNQMECHQQQISGVWSINAKQFCKEAGVDYDQATLYQNRKEMEDQEQYEAESIQNYEETIGDLTEAQFQRIAQNALEATSSDDGYSAYFWFNVVEQLEAK